MRIKASQLKQIQAPTERQIQIQFTTLIRPLQFNSIFAFHIDNGGSAIKKSILSKYRQGVVSGVPDYMVISLIDKSFFFIEFKSLKGRLSKEQKALHEKLKKYNINVFVVRDATEGLELVKKYFNLKNEGVSKQKIPIFRENT